MTTYTLPRDGRRPVRFQGTLLAASDGQYLFHPNNAHTRYYDLAVYQLDDGRYIAYWHYQTRWAGEADHHRVEVSRTLASVVTDLEDFDATDWVEGYKQLIANHPQYNTPNRGSGYCARQQALERGIRERYLAQGRELCAVVAGSHDMVETL